MISPILKHLETLGISVMNLKLRKKCPIFLERKMVIDHKAAHKAKFLKHNNRLDKNGQI